MYKFALFFLGAFYCQIGLVQANSFAVADSTKMESRNGKTYVVHQVEPKETVYALSRKYKVPVPQILEANPSIQNGITIGQLVYIPRKTTSKPNKPAKPATAASPATARPVATPAKPTSSPAENASTSRTYTVDGQGQKIHVVEPKQTLFSLSRLYQVNPEEIKKWNNLSSDNINIGAHLIVGRSTVATKAAMYIPEPDDAASSNKSSLPEPMVVTAMAKADSGKPEPVKETTIRIDKIEVPPKEESRVETARTESAEEAEESAAARPSDTAGKVIETGLAEVIEQKGDVNKYLALHKTAPVGTILQVKNIMNGQTVFVRVIGTLPPTGSNEKVIVKVSKKAYQKLAALDSRFRVELSYLP